MVAVSLDSEMRAGGRSRSVRWLEFNDTVQGLAARAVVTRTDIERILAERGARPQALVEQWNVAARTILIILGKGSQRLAAQDLEALRDALALIVCNEFAQLDERHSVRVLFQLGEYLVVRVSLSDREGNELTSRALGQLKVARGSTDISAEFSAAPNVARNELFPMSAKVVGFLLGFVALVGVEFGLLLLAGSASGRQIIPRGLGWIVLPVVAGMASAAVAPKSPKDLKAIFLQGWEQLDGLSVFTRYTLAATLAWFAVVSTYFLTAELDYYQTGWVQFFKALALPPFICIPTAWLVLKLIRVRK